MEKIRILFVDDEEQLLSGLRRMLRDKRHEWDLSFASSGASALELMANTDFDVIVSDMRMPEMTGAELLSIVRDKHPHVARIILSGYAEKEALLQSVGPSHQYLAKPCDPESLKSIIERALSIQKAFGRENIRELVSQLGKIPTPSPTYHRLIDEITSPRATIQSVAKIIESDIALAVQTLKLTNSAYFGLPSKVRNIEQAVRHLGFETLRNLVFVAGFYEAFDGVEWQMQTLERLNRRSLTMARLAKRICQTEGLSQSESETAFSAALLAHVGTLVMVMNRPDDFEQVIYLVEHNGVPIVEAETSIFGASHASIGAYLLGLWGFTNAVVESVAFHHHPSLADNPGFSASTAVHVAQYITRRSAERLDSVERFIKSDLNVPSGHVDKLEHWELMHEEVSNG